MTRSLNIIDMPPSIASKVLGRDELLDRNPITVDRARWRAALDRHGLPAANGLLDGDGRIGLTRRDVLAYADRAVSGDQAMQLLYLSLAWGLGLKASHLRARLTALADAADSLPDLLVEGWSAVREGRSPRECYLTLTTERGRGRARWLGPAFATKFLYFAAGSSRRHEVLIIDRVVSKGLHEWYPRLATAGWHADTYAWYCDVLGHWAEQGGVEPDQIEMALFA